MSGSDIFLRRSCCCRSWCS